MSTALAQPKSENLGPVTPMDKVPFDLMEPSPSPSSLRPVSSVGASVVMDELPSAPVKSLPSTSSLSPVSPSGSLAAMNEVSFASVDYLPNPSSLPLEEDKRLWSDSSRQFSGRASVPPV